MMLWGGLSIASAIVLIKLLSSMARTPSWQRQRDTASAFEVSQSDGKI
jgi:hypothetical protein